MIQKVHGPWPEEPVHEPKNLFREAITDRPVVQFIDKLKYDDWGNHRAAKIMDFPEVSMTLVSIRVGHHHPAHYHIEGPHVAIVLSGTGTMRVEDEEFDVAPGAVVIIPPSSVHFARNTGDKPLEYIQFITPSRPE